VATQEPTPAPKNTPEPALIEALGPAPTPVESDPHQVSDKGTEQLYRHAILMLEKRNYVVAYTVFSRIPDYKNVQEYLDYLQPLVNNNK
jgi:hypothetical protein